MAARRYLKSKPQHTTVLEEEIADRRFLILHNDDVHTFEYVIDTLIEVCELEPVQAEQCTYLVHYKGKCDVKKGDYDFLKPFRERLILRGLEATID